jgi:hypothetical protein
MTIEEAKAKSEELRKELEGELEMARRTKNSNRAKLAFEKMARESTTLAKVFETSYFAKG